MKSLLDDKPKNSTIKGARGQVNANEFFARRLNDAELVAAAASVDKNMEAFRTAYDSALAGNTTLTPASRQTAIQKVDAMKTSAKALHTATLQLPPNSSAAAAWAPVLEELLKVAMAYQVTAAR